MPNIIWKYLESKQLLVKGMRKMCRISIQIKMEENKEKFH